MTEDIPVPPLFAVGVWSNSVLAVLLTGGIAIFTLFLAVKRAEPGYEDEIGYHSGEEPYRLAVRKSSRPAVPCQPIINYTCKHSRDHEVENQGRNLIRHSHLPKSTSKKSGGSDHA